MLSRLETRRREARAGVMRPDSRVLVRIHPAVFWTWWTFFNSWAFKPRRRTSQEPVGQEGEKIRNEKELEHSWERPRWLAFRYKLCKKQEIQGPLFYWTALCCIITWSSHEELLLVHKNKCFLFFWFQEIIIMLSGFRRLHSTKTTFKCEK